MRGMRYMREMRVQASMRGLTGKISQGLTSIRGWVNGCETQGVQEYNFIGTSGMVHWGCERCERCELYEM